MSPESRPRSVRVSPSFGVINTLLRRMPVGALVLRDADGRERTYAGVTPGPSAEVIVRDARAARRIVTKGGIGFAEGYMNNEWDTDDLYSVLKLGMTNLDRVDLGSVPTPLQPAQRAWHRMRDNTRRMARRNIAHHYDLGNDFYRLWLDPTMTYSSALFASEHEPAGEDLTAAQRRKWDRMLDLLQPSRGDRLLEIGCGWGGFAIHAAREAGCHVTGVTLSEEQHDWATRRVAEEGLGGLVDIRLQDYRDVPETYSGIASIEMFEAVGERWWPVFFGRIRELLARGGRAAIQTITIRDERFEGYRDNPDFIQRYIFPGGMLPSPERFEEVATDAGLHVVEPAFFGMSYARTLESWLGRFEAALPDIRALGFDERFVRMWRYYLAYCRIGFESGNCDVMQVSVEP